MRTNFTSRESIINYAILVSLAVLLVAYGAYTLINLFLILCGLWSLYSGYSRVFSRNEWVGGFLFASICWGYALLGLILCAYHQSALKDYGNYLIFLLMPFSYFAFAGIRFHMHWVWIGASIGAMSSFAQALYQVFHLDHVRARGQMDSIQYGNIAILLAATAAIGIYQSEVVDRKRAPYLWLLFAGLICGIGTSLLSGSKGGWLSIITLLAVFFRLVFKKFALEGKIISGALVLILVSILLLEGPVNRRLVSAYNDFQEWNQTGSTAGGSVGPRLELYKFGLSVSYEKPLLGLGRKEMVAEKQKAISKGEFDVGIISFDHLHNEFLDSFVVHGVVGVIQLSILIFAPLGLFIYVWNNGEPNARSFALMGILLVVLHIEFGFSNVLFLLNAVRQTYILWTLLLFVILFQYPWDLGSKFRRLSN